MTSKKRRSIRLYGYDYTRPGAYFVTICTARGECHFGDITSSRLHPSKVGLVAEEYWRRIPEHYPQATSDQFVIMPNHIHGILILHRNLRVGVQNFEPLQHQYQHTLADSVGSIIRSYKAAVTRWCRKNGLNHFQWQRNFYDRIIRSEKEFQRIRKYILNNPANWLEDPENPDLVKSEEPV